LWRRRRSPSRTELLVELPLDDVHEAAKARSRLTFRDAEEIFRP
jgi:hypothetical protein